jgi:hypothetical protein
MKALAQEIYVLESQIVNVLSLNGDGYVCANLGSGLKVIRGVKDLEEVMEWLEENGYLSDAGKLFRDKTWWLFIRQKRQKRKKDCRFI